MKYIEKIDFTKVTEPMIAVTMTNLGNKNHPKLRCHLLNPDKSIEDLGVIDEERVLSIAKEKEINIGAIFGWDGTNEENIRAFMAQRFMECSNWFIGKLFGLPSIKISKLI